MGLLRALTTHRAFTDPEADDPRLRGRSYAVPFVEVWAAALEIAQKTNGWTVVSSDPRAGEIVAEATTRLWGFTDDLWIRLSLDEDGQTRVDLTSASRKGGGDLGTNARRIARFLRSLDARISPEKRVNR